MSIDIGLLRAAARARRWLGGRVLIGSKHWKGRAPLVVTVLALTGALPVRAQTEATAGKKARAPAVAEVVVTGERPAADVQIDRKVYTVTSDLQAAAGVAADVLNNVPSVLVDADGNLSLRGDGNVTVLIDGKPSAQFTGPARALSLASFPANQIDRIEVIANPPAQFKAEGSGGVINIITKKSRRAGGSGSVQASVGAHQRYVLSADGTYNRGPLRLSGGIGLRHDYRERKIATDETAVDPTTGGSTASHEALDETLRRLIPSVKAGADYDLGKATSLGLSFTHREGAGGRFFDQHDVAGPAGGAVASISDRHSDGHAWNADGGEEAHVERKLWRPGETLTLTAQHSGDHERERYAYRNSFTAPVAPTTFDTLTLSHNITKSELGIDYVLPLSERRELRAGYDYEADRNGFDNFGDLASTGTPTQPNPVLTDHFRYRQDIQALYLQYQTPFGPWTAQLGLRAEQADISSLQIAGDVRGGRRDQGLFPTLHLDRAVGDDGKLSASVGRRITRPDPEALDPFLDSQDTHNLRAGNPALRPQDTWSYELGYVVSPGPASYGATAYYRFNRDSVTDILRPVSGDMVLDTKANLPKSRFAGVELSAYGKISEAVAYRLSGDAFYSQIDATGLGGTGLRATAGVNLKASVDWKPTSRDTAQVSLVRTDRRLTPQGSVAAINIVNLGYRRLLRSDLTLLVTVADLFNGQRYDRVIAKPVLRQSYRRDQSGQVGYVGLVYRFGAVGKKPQGFDYEP